jgi:hypothetical protein
MFHEAYAYSRQTPGIGKICSHLGYFPQVFTSRDVICVWWNPFGHTVNWRMLNYMILLIILSFYVFAVSRWKSITRLLTYWWVSQNQLPDCKWVLTVKVLVNRFMSTTQGIDGFVYCLPCSPWTHLHCYPMRVRTDISVRLPNLPLEHNCPSVEIYPFNWYCSWSFEWFLLFTWAGNPQMMKYATCPFI